MSREEEKKSQEKKKVARRKKKSREEKKVARRKKSRWKKKKSMSLPSHRRYGKLSAIFVVYRSFEQVVNKGRKPCFKKAMASCRALFGATYMTFGRSHMNETIAGKKTCYALHVLSERTPQEVSSS